MTPPVIWALAIQTLRQCIRRKVLLVLLLFVAVVFGGSRLMPSHDPVERVEILIRFSLYCISFFGVIVAIFLSATALPEDRTRGTITTVLTKPVGRLNYILGRTLGFALTLGIILLAMGLVSWAFIRVEGRVAARETGRTDVLVGNRFIEPTEVFRYEGDEEKYLPAEADRANLAGGADVRIEYVFRDGLRLLGDTDNYVVEILPRISTSMALPNVEAEITVKHPRERERRAEFAVTLNSRRATRVSFSRELVHPTEGVRISVRRVESTAFISFKRNAFRIMIDPVSFEWSYLKALVMIFFGFMLVVVISITSSTFLSSWVAVLLAFSAYFFARIQKDLIELMGGLKAAAEGEVGGLFGSEVFRAIHGHGGPQEVPPDPFYVVAINWCAYAGMWVLTHIFPDFSRFDAAEFLTRSHDVPWGVIGMSGFVLLCYGLCYLILGHVVFWRRELVP